MRTIVDLPGEQVEALASLCEREGISRAEAVRRAMREFIRTHDCGSPSRPKRDGV
jgi:metal-responsive CopG/Arc/MetJ family transcriptional regulator